MSDRFIVTPFFMDEEWPQLERLELGGRQVNKPALGEGSQMARMSVVHRALAERVF